MKVSLNWLRELVDLPPSVSELVERINALLHDIERNPFKGIGKPEPLRGDLAGWWSRRITGDHRFVYRTRGAGDDQRIEIAACRYHYSGKR